MSINEITVSEIAEALKQEELLILDVREPWEIELAQLAVSTNIPMHQVPENLAKLPTDKPIYVMCHHGGRSMQVAQFLVRHGYKHVFNITGGIHAWSCEIDQKITTY